MKSFRYFSRNLWITGHRTVEGEILPSYLNLFVLVIFLANLKSGGSLIPTSRSMRKITNTTQTSKRVLFECWTKLTTNVFKVAQGSLALDRQMWCWNKFFLFSTYFSMFARMCWRTFSFTPTITSLCTILKSDIWDNSCRSFTLFYNLV